MDGTIYSGNGKPMERLLYEVKKVIVGQDHLLERLVVALLARGHILVEGVPGLAKTMAIKTLGEAIGGDFRRIQFTPDLVPADLIGTRIYNQKTGDFTALGPVFTNLLAAALSFIQRQQRSTRIGIVAFAGCGELVQAPTNDQEMLEDVVKSLLTGRRTAIGSAIIRSLAAIAEIDPSVAPPVTAAATGSEPAPVPGGAYTPSIIVLLADGASNQGPPRSRPRPSLLYLPGSFRAS